MPGLASYGAPALEGDYSDYTIYDSFDEANVIGTLYNQYAIVNKAETIILLVDRANLVARKYTIATKTLAAAVLDYDFPGVFVGTDTIDGTGKSVQGTYVVAVVHGQTGIAIWKDGVLIETITDTDLGLNAGTVYGVSISRSGKYVIVSGTRAASGNVGWVVLVGS